MVVEQVDGLELWAETGELKLGAVIGVVVEVDLQAGQVFLMGLQF